VTSAAKQQALELSQRYVCPDRVRFLTGAGIDLVIGRREGYRIWDVDGRELIDIHLNGGVYNLGHRNPQVIAALTEGLETLDIGNHHFPSTERAALAERLVELTPGAHYVVFASGGGEAIDLAIKSARRATGRRRVVSVTDAYHGHTGLALAAGDEQAASAFLASEPEFVRVPFNDVAALEAVLSEPAAAVILETVPATAGFPRPAPGYLQAVRVACDANGAVYIADEVQTGLGRSGSMWAVQGLGVVPDILVTGKGLSGGIYPIAATLLNQRAGAWLEDDGWSHVSTFGGAELGCRVASTVLDLTAAAIPDLPIDRWTQGFAALHAKYPQWVLEVRQTGLIIGVKFGHEMGGMLMTKLLFDQGVWAMFAGFDRSVLQVKPGLLMHDEIDEVLAAFDRACAVAASW
jgi:acetylornithine/succinyldiaminopimelate/putrescine aminotransferase